MEGKVTEQICDCLDTDEIGKIETRNVCHLLSFILPQSYHLVDLHLTDLCSCYAIYVG